jgi:hypothetical protein
MYGLKVTSILKHNDSIIIGGEKVGDGQFMPGLLLTDGNRFYEVLGIPFVRYLSVEAMKSNISLEVKFDGYDEKELNGKVLQAL